MTGELVYRHEGGNTILAGDVDGDGGADFEIEITGSLALTGSALLL